MSCHFVAAAHDRSHGPGSPANRCSALDRAFQATVRSAMRTFPFVSGLNKTATRKIAKPTTVVTRMDRTRKGDLVGGAREPRKSE